MFKRQVVWAMVWGTILAGPSQAAIEPAALVQTVRVREAWLSQVESLWLRVEIDWTKSAQGLALRRAQLMRQFPQAVLDPNRFVDLRPSTQGVLEYAFDRTRMRFLSEQAYYWNHLKIWDGQRLTVYEEDVQGRSKLCFLEDTWGLAFEQCLAGMSWPRTRSHSFWWYEADVQADLGAYGRAPEFRLQGQQTYRGIDCYVLSVQPRDVRGIMIGHGPGHYIGDDFRQAGFIGEVRGIVDQAFRWYVGVRDHMLYGVTWLSEGRPFIEYWMSDHREVQPNGWIPMVQGYTIYEKADAGEPFACSHCRLKVTKLAVDETLPDSLFQTDIPKGTKVYDRTRRGRQGRKPDSAYARLVGKTLPRFHQHDLDQCVDSGLGKVGLLCFFDIQQRPSRHLVRQLARQAGQLQEKGVRVVAVQDTTLDDRNLEAWKEDNRIPFIVGMIRGDEAQVRLAWGVKSLPWMILTDRQLMVRAEGFGIAELGQKIQEMKRAQR